MQMRCNVRVSNGDVALLLVAACKYQNIVYCGRAKTSYNKIANGKVT